MSRNGSDNREDGDFIHWLSSTLFGIDPDDQTSDFALIREQTYPVLEAAVGSRSYVGRPYGVSRQRSQETSVGQVTRLSHDRARVAGSTGPECAQASRFPFMAEQQPARPARVISRRTVKGTVESRSSASSSVSSDSLSDDSGLLSDFDSMDNDVGYQDTDHDARFRDGRSRLSKIVLEFDVDGMSDPRKGRSVKKRYNRDEFYDYYSTYRSLIRKEVRCMIAQGIERIHSNETNKKPLKLGSANFVITHIKFPKNPENPAILDVTGRLPKEPDCGCSSVIVYFQFPWGEQTYSLGLLDQRGENERRHSLRVILEDDDDEQLRAYVSEANQADTQLKVKLQANILGSIVTEMRMYDVCCREPNDAVVAQLIQGQLPAWPGVPVNERYRDIISELNPTQKQVVSAMLSVQSGAYCLQGPPGTGKTTTIIALLKCLMQEGERVLVSAPSNKAVQEIALRFIPFDIIYPVALAGVKNKLDERLEGIFIHSFCDLLKDALNMQKTELERISLSKLRSYGSMDRSVFFNEMMLFFDSEINSLKSWVTLRLGSRDREQLIFSDLLSDLTRLKKRYSAIKEADWPLSLEKHDKQGSSRFSSTDRYRSVFNGFKATYDRHLARLDGIDRQELEVRLLNHAKILFMTTSAAGRHIMTKIDHDYGMVIIDEAAQSIEIGTMIPLKYPPEKLLLVGDPKQLPATVLDEQAARLGYQRSLMSRLMSDCGVDYQMLDIQYRMHPEIRRWPSQQFYQGALRDGSNTLSRDDLFPGLYATPCLGPYVFIDVKGKEQPYSKSFANHQEANSIVKMLKYLCDVLHIDLAQHVGVITFYAGQQTLLSNKLKSFGVLVKTVDGYQGGEKNIIIISFVRSNNQTIGFLKDFRRLNVAITRAKYALIMFGHVQTLTSCESDLKDMIEDAVSRNKVVTIKELNSRVFSEKGPASPAGNQKADDKKPKKKGRAGKYSKLSDAGNTTLFSNKTKNKKKLKRNNAPRKKEKVNTQPCRFFNMPRGCRKGEECDFIHATR